MCNSKRCKSTQNVSCHSTDFTDQHVVCVCPEYEEITHEQGQAIQRISPTRVN